MTRKREPVRRRESPQGRAAVSAAAAAFVELVKAARARPGGLAEGVPPEVLQAYRALRRRRRPRAIVRRALASVLHGKGRT